MRHTTEEDVMRVLYLVNNFPSASSPSNGIFNLRHIEALARRGYDARVIRFVPWVPLARHRNPHHPTLPLRYEVDGIPVQILRGLVGPRRWGIGTLLPLQLYGALQREIAAFKPDVVHAHGLLPSGLLAKCTGRRYIITAHGSETYRLPWMRSGLERLSRKVVGDAAAVVAVSQFVGSHLRRLGRERVDVIYNGADRRLFTSEDRAQAREALGIDRSRRVVAFTGHLRADKGIIDLINATSGLTLRPKLLVAGDGPGRRYIVERAQHLNIDVAWFGFVSQERVAQILKACDCFALPSYAEGLPTAVCEALNCGRAVVASNVGGIPEIVRHGENGYVHEAGDVDALRDALNCILSDDVLRSRFERNAETFAREHLTWEANAASYDAIYHSLGSWRVEEQRAGT